MIQEPLVRFSIRFPSNWRWSVLGSLSHRAWGHPHGIMASWHHGLNFKFFICVCGGLKEGLTVLSSTLIKSTHLALLSIARHRNLYYLYKPKLSPRIIITCRNGISDFPSSLTQPIPCQASLGTENPVLRMAGPASDRSVRRCWQRSSLAPPDGWGDIDRTSWLRRAEGQNCGGWKIRVPVFRGGYLNASSYTRQNPINSGRFYFEGMPWDLCKFMIVQGHLILRAAILAGSKFGRFPS